MADLNWCTFCDNAISPFSKSLYCSEQCLRSDALRNHPLLGYTYPEFTDFPRANNSKTNSYYQLPSPSHSVCSSPALTATTTASSLSSESPPKFSLLSSSHTLPPVITPATAKPIQFNYFSNPSSIGYQLPLSISPANQIA